MTSWTLLFFEFYLEMHDLQEKERWYNYSVYYFDLE